MRKATKQENLLILDDPDYPIRFHILKSGVEDCYLLVDEDPIEHSINIRNTEQILELCHQFDSNITKDDLPKFLTNDSTQENQTTQDSTKESTI